jgi:hypothetical protein
MWQQLLPTISLNEMNELAGQWITDGKNCMVVVTAPEDAVVPSENDIKKMFQEQNRDILTGYTDKVMRDPLQK